MVTTVLQEGPWYRTELGPSCVVCVRYCARVQRVLKSSQTASVHLGTRLKKNKEQVTS